MTALACSQLQKIMPKKGEDKKTVGAWLKTAIDAEFAKQSGKGESN